MKTLCKIENKEATPLFAVPSSCESIAWFPEKNGILFTNPSQNKVGFIGDQVAENFVSWYNMSGPKGICISPFSKNFYVEETGRCMIKKVLPISLRTCDKIGRKAIFQHNNQLKNKKGCEIHRVNGMSVISRSDDIGLAAETIHRVLNINRKSEIVPFLGCGKPGFSQCSDPKLINMKSPSGIALCKDKNTILVSDTGNHIVREFSFKEGKIEHETLYGMPCQKGCVEGKYTKARFQEPRDIVCYKRKAYVVDQNKIFEINLKTGACSVFLDNKYKITTLTCDSQGTIYFLQGDQCLE